MFFYLNDVFHSKNNYLREMVVVSVTFYTWQPHMATLHTDECRE